jgi:uncharacterized phage protein gp47/JayE
MNIWSYYFERMRAYLLGRPGNLFRLAEGNRVQSLLEAQAQMLEELSFEADSEYAGLYAPSASGDRLLARARELGIERKPAQTASGYFRFEGSEDSEVLVGAHVATGDPETEDVVDYFTTESGIIPEGETSIDLAIEAAVVGAAGNASAGVVDVVVDDIPGITGGSNPSAVSGGAEEESDDDLRSRCVLARYRDARGVERHWECLAGDVTGVARAKCLACTPAPGCFHVLVWSRDSEGRLVAAGEPLLEAVQDYLEQFALACISLEAVAPPGPVQDTIGYLTVAEGHSYEGCAIAAKVALGAVYAGLVADQTLTRAALIAAAMSVDYAVNFRLAEPAADVEPSQGETIVAGLIQVLPLEWDQGYL